MDTFACVVGEGCFAHFLGCVCVACVRDVCVGAGSVCRCVEGDV